MKYWRARVDDFRNGHNMGDARECWLRVDETTGEQILFRDDGEPVINVKGYTCIDDECAPPSWA